MAVCRVLLVLLLSVQSIWACYPHPNLMVCWEMQEGRALRVKDSVGSRFSTDGIMTGAVAWVPAQNPRGFQFTKTSSNSFVNTGSWMVSFPGTDGADVRSGGDVPSFNFIGETPFQVGLTIALDTLSPAEHSELVSNCAVGEGWEFHFETNRNFIFYILGVATYDFGTGSKIQDLNPHRVFLARKAGTILMFLDGESVGDKSLPVGSINAGNNALVVGGSNSAVGNFTGKANNLAIYNFPWQNFDEIAAFAKNDYLFWQGMRAAEWREEK